MAKKITLIGNLDLNQLLPFGKPYEISIKVKELVEKIGQGGRYILSSCNSLTSAVPVENALTAHLVCERFGVYAKPKS
ncbi:uroporphyrinogen decarboxylase family protein [Thermatribacter velox]|uniref:Uroporphyrinogen decarboxylase family protein n=1 Tax=Thermatribacter velox TaxID=3039681 RepID=A0ABZ2Y8T4_9BACT